MCCAISSRYLLLTSVLAMAVASGAQQGSAPRSKGGTVVAKPLYDLRDRSLPRVYSTEYPLKDEVTDIFAVPRSCSVGTNSLGNGVTILDLCGEKVRYDRIVRDYTREARAGAMSFLPDFAKDTIGYAKTRTFFLVNLAKREVQHYRLASILEYKIHRVGVIDWSRRLFAVSLDFTQTSGTETEIQIVDLSGADVKVTAAFEIKDTPRWTRLGKTTFYFTENGESLRLHALNERLQETSHPLLGPFNHNAFPGRPDLPDLHPSLPFAVFGALEEAPAPEVVVWLAHWKKGAAAATVLKISDSESGDFRFSPDGRWLLFLDGSTGPNRLMVMPVDSSLPHYLGPPMVLHATEKIDELGSNCSWISDPPAVVCTINRTEQISTTGEERHVNKLLKWDLPPGSGHK